MNKLSIADEKSFRVTRYIKNKCIRFKYDNKKYQITVENIPDGITSCILSLDEYNESKNTYESTGIKSYTKYCIDSLVIDVSKHNNNDNITYTNIDKVYMIKILTHIGLLDGKYNELCEINRKQQDELDKKIKSLENEIEQLKKNKEAIYNKYFNPTGHGSKLSEHDIKKVVSDRKLGTGYKKGDFVEQYKAKIGDTHIVYGGELTDLRNLPYGTAFECCNGNWIGYIGYNNKGNKVVIIPNAETEVELSESYCCLYINILKGEDE